MKRLQFLMEDELVKHLDGLVEETGLKTRTQLLNSALTLFDWAVRERKGGRVIASVDEKADKYKEIDLPGLPAVKQEEEDYDTLVLKLLRKLYARAETDTQRQLAADLIEFRNKGMISLVELRTFLDEYITPKGPAKSRTEIEAAEEILRNDQQDPDQYRRDARE